MGRAGQGIPASFKPRFDLQKGFRMGKQKEESSDVIKRINGNQLLTIQKMVAELLGTYLLVFVGCGAAYIRKRDGITLTGVALTWALDVVAIVYAIAHISGSHINPAATLAFAVVGLFPWKLVLLYVMSQLVGAIFGSLTLRWLFDGEPARLMLTQPVGTNPASDLTVMAWEIIITFILLFVICESVLDPRASKGLGGMAIGAAVFVDVILAEDITGCSLNPARSIGPAIVNWNFSKLWIYIISPTIGAVAGTSLYSFLRLTREPETSNYIQNIRSPSVRSDHVLENPTYLERSLEIA
ncbi:hypothetical protein HPP92_005997 [Vanilla planifolia]|uniref:Aquaporin n=1 Tax=Vanilla planifolia TaxID=51239 RepID=A0A835RNV3_VANPL|nr:hypothetical protein HPP92_005997 [Vanilla planifolia]